MVRGEGWYMVRWVALAALATVPKSPLSPYCFLIRDSWRPVAAAKACNACFVLFLCLTNTTPTKNQRKDPEIVEKSHQHRHALSGSSASHVRKFQQVYAAFKCKGLHQRALLV